VPPRPRGYPQSAVWDKQYGVTHSPDGTPATKVVTREDVELAEIVRLANKLK
jgi:hypothetical protein